MKDAERELQRIERLGYGWMIKDVEKDYEIAKLRHENQRLIDEREYNEMVHYYTISPERDED
jgi:hypothetical protein